MATPVLLPRASAATRARAGAEADRWGRPMIGDFPRDVLATIRRILDAEARRLLADEGEGDALGTLADADNGAGDGGADQLATAIEG